jgi:hypothetical protein
MVHISYKKKIRLFRAFKLSRNTNNFLTISINKYNPNDFKSYNFRIWFHKYIGIWWFAHKGCEMFLVLLLILLKGILKGVKVNLFVFRVIWNLEFSIDRKRKQYLAYFTSWLHVRVS